ncbi:hypothetical protein F5B18DRAFT_603871, partial [Nemania serpens]
MYMYRYRRGTYTYLYTMWSGRDTALKRYGHVSANCLNAIPGSVHVLYMLLEKHCVPGLILYAMDLTSILVLHCIHLVGRM